MQGKRQQERLVIVRLCGGLGNQMFQYACSLAVAKHLNLPLKADLDYYYNTPDCDAVRKYELTAFTLQLAIVAPKDLPPPNKSLLQKLLVWLLDKPRFSRLTERRYYVYDSCLFATAKKRRSLYLDGYWQCYHYFQHLREELLKAFQLRQPNLRQAELAAKGETVAVHIRRGDYAHNAEANSLHGLCSIRYYQEAMTYVAKQVPNALFMVFSDDIAWCKENLELPYPHVFMEPEGDSAAQDLILMSLCKHQIISNSTFGWWAAWLAENPRKIVVAPKNWLAEPHPNAEANDLIPPQWIRM